VRPDALLAYVVCVSIWGTTFFAIRVCIGPGGYATYQAAALRFVLAASILASIAATRWARPGPSSRKQVLWICGAGFLNFANYALVYTAEETITGGLACVLYGTLPLFTALIAGALGLEKIKRSAVAGSLLSLLGIGIIFWEQLGVSSDQVFGITCALGAVTMGALIGVTLKRYAGGVHPFAQNAWFLGATALPMAALALIEHRPIPWPPPAAPTVALLYLAIAGSVIAFASFLYLIQRVTLMTSSTVVLVQPLIALLVDALWEAQPVGGSIYAGAAFIIGGIALNLRGRK
jgi:drug/metabolite transporter (DMT)-like permease